MTRFAADRPTRRTGLAEAGPVHVFEEFNDGYFANDYVDLWVRGATETASGIVLKLRTSWQRNLACMPHYLVARRGGQYLGHVHVDEGGAAWSDCSFDVSLPAPGASLGDRLTVAFYPDTATIAELKSGSREASYTATVHPSAPEQTKVDEAPDEGGESPFTDSIAAGVSDAIGTVATPVLTWGGIGLGAYVAWQSRESIADATRSLIKSAD